MRPRRGLRTALALASVVVLTACAHVPNPPPEDPYESFNRGMFQFNETVDRYTLKPIATGYNAVVPGPVRTCIHNIFGNVGDVWSGVNSFLQGRGRDFVDTFGRVLFNSTVGLGGCIDVASMNGARKVPNDFGMTLGVWGFNSGPYLVLPFLGASSVRDGTGTLVTLAAPGTITSAVFAINDVPVRNSLIGLYLVDARASLLEDEKLVDQIALDKYSFIRDAYLQRRKAMLDSRRAGEHASTAEALGAAGDDYLPVYEDPDLLPPEE
ncbi:VacJ family lipoprotein [Castellaniella sp.]|uniref:MlaA family lipoprotein n=1 Tax=Castellaniella sp. TaxID=1955812 RepID=UPI0035674EB7